MIIIPIYNIGELLYNNISKFFVKVDNKFLIEHCLESLDLEGHKLIFIISEKDAFNYKIDKILRELYEDSIIQIIDYSTSVLETIYKSSEKIKDNEEIIIFSPPFTYFKTEFDFKNIKEDVFLLLVKTNNPIYCYAEIKDGIIVNFKEKQVISEYGLLGVYYFKNKSLDLKAISM